MTQAKSGREQASEAPSDRRQILSRLLGFGAVAGIGGCAVAAGAGPSGAGEASQALTGSATWFDTITGPGGLRTLRPAAPGSYGQTVLVAGHTNANDGGGGSFAWTNDATAADDNGLVIVPPTGAGLSAGCWKRVYAGPLSVRWFGAQGNAATLTDGAAIQAAINAATARGGGVVYVPAGDYCVAAPIVLPKRFGGQPVPISLIGEGGSLPSTPATGRRNGSCLRWASASTQGALLTYDSSDPSDTYLHVIEDLIFLRGDGYGPGTLFSHPRVVGGANGVARWRSGVIRNCVFASDTAPGVLLVELAGGWNSLIDNVILHGGDVGLSSVDGSRLDISNLQTLQKYAGPSRAIYVSGGGTHVIRHCRFEGSTPGNPRNAHITLTGGTAGIEIDSVSAEGNGELWHLDIDNARIVNVTNPNLGPVRISSASSRVDIRGGTLCGLPATALLPARPAIRVEAGARHVHITGPTVANAASQVVIDDDTASVVKTKDVVIELYDEAAPTIYAMVFRRGMFDDTYVDNQTLYRLPPYKDPAGAGLYVVPQPPYCFHNSISTGQDGEVITLLLTGTKTAFIGNATGLGPTAAPLFVQSEAPLPKNSTIRFIFHAGAWYELGRSVNNGGTGAGGSC